MKQQVNTAARNSPEIARLQAFLNKDPDIELAILFGSMASGNFTFNSDLDLSIQQHNPLTSAQKNELIEKITLITGRSVDLIDLHTVGEPLLGQILKHGKRLKGSNTLYAELGLKHVYAMADFVPYIERTLKERRNRWLNT